MHRLNLPTYSLNIKSGEGRKYIFDPIRKKFVVLNPEEWVRQNFIQFLVQDRDFPAPLISVEQEFTFNRMKKRSDILVHGSSGEPLLMVECKAPPVKITREVFEQIGLYNLSYRLPWLIVTNGMKHYCCRRDPAGVEYGFVDEIPSWELLREDAG
jgi:hypothetical protein